MHRFTLSVLGVLGIGVSVMGAAHAQGFPGKPLRFITNAAGGGNDFIARLVGPPLSERLGQPVIIDNRSGGSLPANVVAKSPPDGYTLLVSGGTFWIGTLLQDDLPYNVANDFLPITLLGTSPNILVVHPSLPARSVKELVALARAKPGQLNYSAPSIGAAQHLAAELLKSMAKVDIVRVSYRGTSPALMAVASGEAHITFATASAAPIVRATKLRALAITDTKRSSFFPDLPTMAESGFPGYEANAMQGIFAPAKTPPAIINRLYEDIAAVLRRPDVRERLTASSIEPGGNPPGAFAAMVQSEMTRMGKVIREANIRAD
jgi:tripartite-type tricarboxylate transporter receptor subunit TctC